MAALVVALRTAGWRLCLLEGGERVEVGDGVFLVDVWGFGSIVYRVIIERSAITLVPLDLFEAGEWRDCLEGVARLGCLAMALLLAETGWSICSFWGLAFWAERVKICLIGRNTS